jgi:hypothetical protein
MMEESFPEMHKMLKVAARFSNRELRESFAADKHDEITGTGDITLNEEVASRPGVEIFQVLEDVRDVRPEDNESVFAIGERHLDLMSPTHLRRGMLCVPGAGFLWLPAWFALDVSSSMAKQIAAGEAELGMWLSGIPMVAVSTFLTWLMWHVFVSFDWFHYRSNPIRFDRERRMVHVWRSRRAGGSYSVPWDENLVVLRGGLNSEGTPHPLVTAFFCIDPVTGRIKRRIAVGKPTYERSESDAFYEYVRRFMQQGPCAVPAPKRFARMTPSLAYSFNAWFNFTGIAKQRRKGEWTLLDWGVTLLLAPMHLLLALSHFIAMLTSRTPKWPAQMQ